MWAWTLSPTSRLTRGRGAHGGFGGIAGLLTLDEVLNELLRDELKDRPPQRVAALCVPLYALYNRVAQAAARASLLDRAS